MVAIKMNHLVDFTHPYRKILEIVDFEKVFGPELRKLRKGKGKVGRDGYDIVQAFKALLLQYLEDLSDRQAEKYFKENLAAKLFCGFELGDKTFDHTFFCVFRKTIGSDLLAKLFNIFRDKLKEYGLIKEIFTFVDASKLISKEHAWSERDKAIEDGEEKLNNINIEKYSKDKDAKFGCKGKRDFWFGFKRHNSVDMQSGLINKAEATPANTPDCKAFESICPNGGATFADKAYTSNEIDKILAKNNCANCIIKKNNNADKNKDLDRWRSSMRSPHESVFSKLSKRVRYKGLTKVKFQVLMESTAFNLKRLTKLSECLPPGFGIA
jgi:IS5 family transposase